MMQIPIVDSKKTSRSSQPVDGWSSRRSAVELELPLKEPQTFEELIRQLRGVPKKTAVLGQTSDGLPLLFNLDDARPSSLLVVADRFCGKTALLKIMASSLARFNRPEEVRFAVISSRPEEWMELETRFPGHFMKIVPNTGIEAEELIYHLCDLVEARQKGLRIGTAYVLIFDGMESLAQMDVDLRANFEWLVRSGARQQIWPLGVLNSDSYLPASRYAELFRTRIIGPVSDPRLAARFLPPRFHHSNFDEDQVKFTVRIHQHWLQFTLPDGRI